ncbi:hypothetical protein BGZ76_011629 [Entomortierella beljakovae]|nr:hypothetical protein BGZ76_011629 [Entomortierella beljakovae]
MAPVTAASASSSFDKLGYWSPNTASVDWCESNYEVTYYIAEVLHVQQRAIRPNPKTTSLLIHRALGFGAFAVTIWLIDLRLCEFINGVGPKTILRWNPQLHAWWHIFSGLAMYHAAMLVSYYHYDVQGRKPDISMWYGMIPALVLDGQKKKKI